MTGVSVEDGTLTVSNTLNKSSGKEAIITQTDQNGDSEMTGPVEDEFDFSLEYDIVITWAIVNSTCQQAMKNNRTKYACRSVNSDCRNVTHGEILLGYRCMCFSGFTGNPYVQDGCTGTSIARFVSMCTDL